MSNWQGELNSVFTGLVSSVSLQDDGLVKNINLQCSGHNYDTVAEIFYRKALFFYQLSPKEILR